jgi:tetratricopeptide (TPR) repeat protein
MFVVRARMAALLLALVIAPLAFSCQQEASSQYKSAGGPASPGSPGPAPVVKADASDQLQPLENLIAEGQYDHAQQGLGQYLQGHDGSAKAHYDLGYVFFRTHQIGNAVRELSKSLQLDDKDPQAHKILGLVCTFVGRYDLAEVELQAAAQLEPESAEIHYFLGRVYFTRQVFPMALKEFQTAVQLNPLYMKAYANLGLVMEVLGKEDQAVEDYTTAERMNEQQHLNSPWPFEYLSAHYNRDRQPDQAIDFAQKTLAIDPRCDLAYYELAKGFQTEDDWQKAVDAVQKAIAINSSTPEYFYLLSTALRKLGRTAESEAALKHFQEIHNDQDAMAKLWRDANHQADVPRAAPPQDDEP